MTYQPLNEADNNELLEAYQKISDTFDQLIPLMNGRVPYDEWPDVCKIAGLSEELMGSAKEGEHIQIKIKQIKPDFAQQAIDNASECEKHLIEAIKAGWKNVHPYSRPDESFRSMLEIMSKWKDYMNEQRKLEVPQSIQQTMILKIQNLGRCEQKLRDLLKHDLFDLLSKHNQYWHHEDSAVEDKLDDIRGALVSIKYSISDTLDILIGDEDAKDCR